MTLVDRWYPLRLPSAANLREHWAKRAKRVAAHRMLGRHAMVGVEVPAGGKLRCTLVRCGPRLLDDDNLASSLKGLRDGIAQGAGLDDGDARWEWQYAQARTGDYAVHVVMEALP